MPGDPVECFAFSELLFQCFSSDVPLTLCMSGWSVTVPWYIHTVLLYKHGWQVAVALP
jgi:hypothetical protein